MANTRTLLLVEDDLEVRNAIVETLADAGYQVETAANGFEALEQLRGRVGSPCLILLDLMMPVMDGWEFRDAQRRDETLAPIPVVAFTALGECKIDAAACLQKPIQLDQLLDVVARYCT
ncbi:MAG: response regulator [Deltaproteobacteria bacterium]|nr:response regulator [Deltaproteobacteria bacterium]